MKGKFKKVAAAFAAVTVLVGSMPSTMFAADYTAIDAPYKAQIKKILVVEADAQVPPLTFGYSIEAGAAVTPAPGYIQVYAGPTSEGKPAISSVGFSSISKSADDADVLTTDELRNAYDNAVGTINVDFTGLTFAEPGVYRYIITENDSVAAGVTDDVAATTLAAKTVSKKRTLDVWVEDNGSGSLIVTDYVLYDGVVAAAPVSSPSNLSADSAIAADKAVGRNGESDGAISGQTKSDRYINKYETSNLTISKNVTGNQGSRDKYFDFTVTFSGGVAGAKYTVDIDGAESSSTNNTATIDGNQTKTNVTEIILDGSGADTTHFYLKAGQSITIKGIANGTQYSVEENEEDYSPKLTVTGDTTGGTTSKDGGAATTYADDAVADKYADTGITADTRVTFTNDRSGVLPTGIIMSVAPAAVVGLGVLAAIIAMVVAGKKRAAEEE